MPFQYFKGIVMVHYFLLACVAYWVIDGFVGMSLKERLEDYE